MSNSIRNKTIQWKEIFKTQWVLWWAVTCWTKTFRVTFRFLQNIELFKGKKTLQNFWKTYQWYKQELQKVLQPKQQRKWQYISMNIFWQNFSPQNAVNGYVEEVLLTKLYPANYFAWAEMGYLTWCTEGCSWKKKYWNISTKKNPQNRKNNIRNINSTIKISSIASDR